MSGTRAQLGAALTPLLLDAPRPNYNIVTDPRILDNLDPSYRGTLQIVRNRVKWNPVAPQAQNVETLHVWVITHQHEQPAAEDDLDALLDEVLDALQQLGPAGEPDAERMKHPDGHHAYRLAVTYITDKE